jgi:hypothetical protein
MIANDEQGTLLTIFTELRNVHTHQPRYCEPIFSKSDWWRASKIPFQDRQFSLSCRSLLQEPFGKREGEFEPQVIASQRLVSRNSLTAGALPRSSAFPTFECPKGPRASYGVAPEDKSE